MWCGDGWRKGGRGRGGRILSNRQDFALQAAFEGVGRGMTATAVFGCAQLSIFRTVFLFEFCFIVCFPWKSAAGCRP